MMHGSSTSETARDTASSRSLHALMVLIAGVTAVTFLMGFLLIFH